MTFNIHTKRVKSTQQLIRVCQFIFYYIQSYALLKIIIKAALFLQRRFIKLSFAVLYFLGNIMLIITEQAYTLCQIKLNI